MQQNRSPLFYVGGKFYLAEVICKLLDYSISCYVEPFFGSGQVFFRKYPHKLEIINDIDEDLINFYRIWYERKDELIEVLDKLPYSRAWFNWWLREWKKGYKGKDDFEKAVRYFYLLRSSFSGNFQSWSISFNKKDHPSIRYYSAIELLNKMHKRIKNAQIECKDYKELLERLIDEEIMLYCDPPYYGTEFYYGTYKFDKEEHYKLAEILNSMKKAKIIVSYYYFDGITELYPPSKWIYLQIEKVKHSYGVTKVSKRKEKPKGLELIIKNYVL